MLSSSTADSLVQTFRLFADAVWGLATVAVALTYELLVMISAQIPPGSSCRPNIATNVPGRLAFVWLGLSRFISRFRLAAASTVDEA